MIINKYKNDCNRLELFKKINNINSLIEINEIIKRTQEKYIDNYYNNINLINVLASFRKSENNEIKQLFLNNKNDNNNTYETPQKNEKKINGLLDNPPLTSINNNFLSKKIKCDNNNKILDDEKPINNFSSFEDNHINKYDNNDDSKEFNNNFNKNSNISNYNYQKEDEEIEKERLEEEDKEKEKENNLDDISNIIPIKIICEAYCSTEVSNSFVVFNSINNHKSYLIYATKNLSIISYNISNYNIERINRNAHSSFISNFKYYLDINNKKNELIMSLSYLDRNLKIWSFINWQCLINIKDIIYYSGYLFSACFFNENKNNYFVASNYADKDINYPDSIKVYNFKNKYYKKIKIINDSKYNTLLIKSYINNNDIYIVACGENNIRAYDFYKNVLP